MAYLIKKYAWCRRLKVNRPTYNWKDGGSSPLGTTIQRKEKSMRLWSFELIPYLPNSQLLAQWREIAAIRKNHPNHILINYAYEYPEEDMDIYSDIVLREMKKRGMKPSYGEDLLGIPDRPPFPRHHNKRYLLQCFYNLQEKYDRGQRDFYEDTYNTMLEFVKRRTK